MASKLAAEGHKVVVSFETILEIAAPMILPSSRTNVMTLCRRLETLPLAYLDEPRISVLELKEAMAAFQEQREFNLEGIDPFVEQFEDCVLTKRRRYTIIPRHGIGEILFHLWTDDPGIFEGYRKRGKSLESLIQADRALPIKPKLEDGFVVTVQKDLALYGLAEPSCGVEQFARWIYRSPSRCPGIRLKYEVYHLIRRNVAAKVRPSDIVDLARIASIPYVDIFIADAAMRAYASQVIRSTGGRYRASVFSDVNTALKAASDLR